MPEPLPLEIIQESAAKLNTLTDAAARTVQAAEAFLRDKCSVGVYAYVITAAAAGDTPTEERLAYTKCNSRYRICIENTDGMDDYECKAWAECSREEKLRSFPKLPALIKKIAVELQKQKSEIETATEQTINTLAALTNSPVKASSPPKLNNPPISPPMPDDFPPF